MNTTVTNKIIDKIQKLLKMTGSREQGEAETALKMAQELAIKYDIDLSNIPLESEKESKQEFVKETADLGARMPVAQKFINPILMKYFGVHLVTGGGRWDGRKMYFIGRKDKAEFAKWVNEFLNNTFMNLWRSYQIATRYPTTYRDSYLLGLQQGLMQKLEENKKKVEAEFVTDPNKYALVLVDEKKQIVLATQKFFGSNLRKGPKQKINPIVSSIQGAGHSAGYKINIHGGELR